MKEHIKGKIQQMLGVKGVVTVAVLEPKTDSEKRLVDKMRENRERLKNIGNNAEIYADNMRIQKSLENTCMVKRYVQDNIVTTVGLTQITKGLSSNLAGLSELQINYTAIGTGTTTPVAGDTTLTTETYRNTVNTLNYSNNILFASMFIDYTEDSGTYKEAGLFINGTATANSGSLFDHVLLNSPTGIVKSTSQILTISFQITFTPV